VTRHEAHSITHTLCRSQVDKNRQNRTFYKALEPAESGLQTLFATALKAKPQVYRHIVNTNVS